MLLEKIELEPGEQILKTVRKHWFIIFLEFFGIFLMLLVPFLLVIGFYSIPAGAQFLNPADTLPLGRLITFGIASWTLFSLLSGFTIWTHYYLDLWVITDRRIILVDQITFFSRNVSIFRLERLQDIEYTIKGIIPTLLNFGTLKAQTAGAHESNFTSIGLPDPRELQAIIQSCMDKRMATLHITPDEVAAHH